MKQEPLVSVIVPVYNVAPYLKRCVDSILCQTYKKIEVWLVDDGSTDESPSICDEYQQLDERVRVIHQKNGGLSAARNAALDKCAGDYLMFVDSDDALSPNGVENLLKIALSQNSDVVVSSNPIWFSEETTFEPFKINWDCVKTNHQLLGMEEALCWKKCWEAWGTIFKRELFLNLRFPVRKIFEDLATIPIAMFYAKTISVTDTSMYYYFLRPGSIMNQNRQKISTDLFDVCKNLISFYKENIEQSVHRDNLCSTILMELCSRHDLAQKKKEENKEFIKLSGGLLRSCAPIVLRSSSVRTKLKVYYLLESFGMHRLISLIAKHKNNE